ncbi:MAG: multifunctional oxoglutarate decarboxylase/oxoglutarate dehydrogenase thiamine pyrophosphate-binding subunit/dihydrolipoyllysine-residue succinyltransferase subunit [Actinomycetota bacterium]|nr:multifunctional oxoglutarate decarboxylase/oxoglutarate dehydrogenase thiamine pyrophosphate-binding subunit/dihydrolipoyllysine-residue succinyltransferase subunit [Actinomycetota bacterium]
MDELERESFGPNMWLVDEMYRRYQENPKAVSESWQEFFDDYAPSGGRVRPARISEPVRLDTHEVTVDEPVAESKVDTPEDASPLKGVAARIAQNMEASLGIPTATSVRTIPAKLLEENRRIINRHLAAKDGGKVSFTHLIGWSVVKGLEAHPAMKSSYLDVDGKPHVVQNKNVNLGLAVDVERGDGQRVLYVPNLKDANDFDFAGFWEEYEDVIRRVRANKLTPDDFAGTTITITNPGTVGTRLSVPRLMPAQGLIVGVGVIDYPSEYEASDPKALAQMGVSKTFTITSTYDHRVIQGAESGEFLAYIHDLLLGSDRFYDEIFASLRIPYEPVRWSRDHVALEGTDLELEKQSRVARLINMYRVRGHLLADLDPIGFEVLAHPELDLSYYGLTVWDLDREFLTDGLPGPRRLQLRKIIDTLRDAYCRTVGVEYMHISDPEQKNWIQNRVEEVEETLERDDKLHLLSRLNAAESFERFIHSKWTGHKRFSIEGAESVIPMLDRLLEMAADDLMIESVMGMAHRGRLNVLANIVGKPLREIFREFEGDIDPDSVQGSGDVKYHLGMTGRFTSRAGNSMAVVLASNPSHLEAVDPVVEGMARAKQDMIGDGAHDQVLPVLLHGDAAFAGQGVVAETFLLSQLDGYTTGGTIHLVINNQLGFTTAPEAGRSSKYATDIAKMVQAPIFHVNGDDPQACVRVVRLAYEFRRQFHKDVVIDMLCYRRHGHNEGDEPAFTQPLMYSKIDKRRSVRKLYTEQLLNQGDITVEDAEASLEDFRARMQQAFEQTKDSVQGQDVRAARPPAATGVLPSVDTGVERERLDHIQNVLTTFPSGFEPHPKLKKMIEARASALSEDAIDWAGAEALALGSLVLEGFSVRLTGQDTRRGTFSQRHSVLVDHRNGEEHVPLASLREDQAPFMVYDSPLSELASMAFEYGYSVANGDSLVLWEAQFGDFINGAQVTVDQFVIAGEDKWDQESGLVLLLPHGYEGQGPEHSSARLERFLQLAAEDSIQVAQPSSAAQYFHLLRRQIVRSVRKPLVVLTPKSLLRAKIARAATAELVQGSFRETIDDPTDPEASAIERILLCSGKIAYPLLEERDKRSAPVAVVRVEQLYPFPKGQLDALRERYHNARSIRWVQEEPRNMGAWTFVHHQLADELSGKIELSVASRHESASPATGSLTIHQQEQEQLIEEAFAS